MNPNGGKSHLTPISHRWRLFASEGTGGNFGAFATADACGAAPVGAATLHVANTAAATAISPRPASNRLIRFLLLLLRRFATPRATRRARASAGGSAWCAPPAAGRARRLGVLARRSGHRP